LLPGQTFLPVDLAHNNYPWRGDTPHVLQNWLISDPLYELYPFLVSAVAAVKSGGAGLIWNPNLFLGHPAMADPLAQSFYPIFLFLGLIFGPARGMAIGLVLHVCLAGLFALSYANLLVRDRLAALLAGITYALGGFLVTWFEHTNWVATLTFAPGVLWMVELALQKRRIHYALWAGIFLALAILGGQYQFVVTLSAFLLPYAVGRNWIWRNEPNFAWYWPWLVVLVTVSLGVMLGGIAVGPFAEFLQESQRIRTRGLQDQLLLRQLITFVLPDFYGNPSFTNYWGVRNYSEVTLYTSVVALFLSLIALVEHRQFWIGYLGGLIVLLLYFVFAGPGVALLGTFPVIKYISLSRSTFLFPLLIGLLAASVLANPQVSNKSILVALGILSIAAAIAIASQFELVRAKWAAVEIGFLRAAGLIICAVGLLLIRNRFVFLRRLIDVGLICLVYVDLFLWGWRYNPAGSINRLLQSTPGIEYLQEHAAPYRVAALQQDGKTLFGPNILSTFGLAEPGGYTSAYSADLQALVRAGDPLVDVGWMASNQNILALSHPSTRLLDLLQVNHVVTLKPRDDPGIRVEFVNQQCVTTTDEITGPIAGHFTIRETAINRIDFLLRRVRPTIDGPLVFRLREDSPSGKLVVESKFTVGDIGPEGSYTLYFSPIEDAPGHSFAWELAAVDEDTPTGVALCQDKNSVASLSAYGADWAQVYGDEIFISERHAPLPRAYVVYGTEVYTESSRAISRLLDEQFDLRNMAVIPQDVGLPSITRYLADPATITEYWPTRVVLEGIAANKGFLILGDAYHPGWQAILNGRTVSVMKVNQVERGILVPAGPYRVIMYFTPKTLCYGAATSGVGLLLFITVWLLDHRRSKRRSSSLGSAE
jgi:MFS family permease